MHVRAETKLGPSQVHERIDALADPTRRKSDGANDPDSSRLRRLAGRVPLKLQLRHLAVPFSACAEVALTPLPSGTEIILRLMWGPLPAPFPRVVAIAGVLAATMWTAYTALASAEGPATWTTTGAVLAAALPLGIVANQRRGERRLQQDLERLLETTPFEPAPH